MTNNVVRFLELSNAATLLTAEGHVTARNFLEEELRRLGSEFTPGERDDCRECLAMQRAYRDLAR